MTVPFRPLVGFRAGVAAIVFALTAMPSLTLAQASGAVSVETQLEAVQRARAAAHSRARSPAERELIQVDLDFADDARSRHVSEAFRDRFSPDGVLIGQEEPVAFGREAAYQLMRGSRAQWHWAPLGARADGNLGATWGVAAIVYRRDNGEMASIQTRYVTVWERRDGRWQMWVDTGNVGPAPQMPGE